MEQVKAHGHVAEVDMGTLHDLEHAQRRGKYVRSSITQSLALHGLGHFPEQLPTYQHETVRVYRRNSPVGRLIDAVLHPSFRGDAELRALARRASRNALG